MQWYILSPAGTSTLTNGGSDEERRLITRYSNTIREEQIPDEDRDRLKLRQATAREALLAADEGVAAGLSAEINTITKLYRAEKRQPSVGDEHEILSTDTWLGEQTANLVAEWLRRWGVSARVKRQTDLRTDSLDGFQLALSELVQWAEATLPGYRASHYRIFFNLAGGFKSVQGFLQTIGMFYADEMVYVFESKDASLLRIPRLPMALAVEANMREHLTLYRRLALGLPVTAEEARPIADTLLMKVDGSVALSAWGELKWQAARDALYREQLWSSPTPKITFSEKFEADVARETARQPDRLWNVNTQLDRLVRYLHFREESNTLDIHPLRGEGNRRQTYRFIAWTDGAGYRMHGHYREDGVFEIEDLGAHNDRL